MDKNLEQFISLVKEYISTIEGVSGETNPHAFLSKCMLLILKIYTLGIELPDVEPDDIEASQTDYPSPTSSIGILLGKYDFYNEVFDPIFDNGIVTSSLSDDLADIYRNLKDPLLEYDSNKKNNAIWSWKFNIQGHCGDHIVDALRAIHRLVNDHMPADYNPFNNGG